MLRFSPWQTALLLALCVLGVVFAAPNLLSRFTAESLPSWVPSRQISLGLDLQGGSHLLFQVQTDSVIREHLDAFVDEARTKLREARIRYQGLGMDGPRVAVTVLDADRLEEARTLLRELDPTLQIAAEDGNRLVLAMTEMAVRQRQASAVDQSIEIIRRRIDETGVREPTIQRQGVDRVLVQLPGIDDPDRIKALIGKTAKMTFHLVDDEADPAAAVAGRVPPGSMLLPLVEDRGNRGDPRQLLVGKRIVVSGENLIDAQPTFQQGEAVVSFRFDAVGGKKFGDATSKNVGKLLAIVLDGRIISAPRIREPILGGSGVITGTFSAAEAQDLALLLRAGALPAPLTVLEERTVGAGLGADSIAAGEIASLIALVLVVAFMVIVYGLFGLFAILALVANLVFIVALLSLLQATLTLPGIAGIVLTIGMAVDANVLIFEHIREEVRMGRTPLSAIEAGFSRAKNTIIDANLTTLIAAVLLYIFGSGPVRGFGVTLSIGIVTTMFSAVTLTRFIVATWLHRARPKTLPI
jgi:preprotein translocase subunit SecD